MTTITEAPTLSIKAPAIGNASIDALRDRIDGDVITPTSPEYEELRKLHDIVVNRHPRAIVRAASTADVVETVRFARRLGAPLAVRSGGHSVAAHSMIDGAIVIDLSAMRAVSIDPVTQTARIQPGVTSGDLAGPAHAYGLALSTGDTSTVGMGGLVTGGGIGWMVRKYGLAIDNLLSAQVVTAEGETVTANPDEHADLFWAIRGGGGNFGIITEFRFRLAPVGQILGGALLLPATREVIRGYLDYTIAAPDDLTTIANLMHAPPAPFVPAERVGEPVLMIMVSWSGDIEEGERAIAPLRALAPPVADTIAPMPYPMIYNYTEMAAAPHAAAIRSMYANELSDEQVDATLYALDHATSPFSMVQFRGLGGEMARVGTEATAFAHRDKRYLIAVLGLWLDASEDAAPHHAWTESLWQQIRSAARGVYVNFLSDEGDDRIREAYPPATFARLSEVKRRYDPDNVFRFNQNIRPR